MRKSTSVLLKLGSVIVSLLLVNFVFAQLGTIKGSVKDAKEPLEGASVILEGKGGGARTNNVGAFEVKVNAGTYNVIVSYVGYTPKTFVVNLAPGATFTLDAVLEKLNDQKSVTVVGTRSAVVRSSTQTVAPVDVFSSKELALTGQIEPTQMINFVAPSFNSSRQTVADGTDHIDPATLRGLGPDQVLVLVNGKRRYNTALLNVNGTIGRGSVGTDLNSIPASAIDKIEVLRDGAASQYGSDAIAGVINVVLKKDVKKTNINIHRGQFYMGDGQTTGIQANQGFALGKKGGYLDLFADIRLREGTNRVGRYGVRPDGSYSAGVYFNYGAFPAGPQRDSIIALDNRTIAERGFSRDNNMQVGNSKVDNYNFALNGGIPLSKNTNLSFMGGYGRRNGQAAGFFRYPFQTSQVIQPLYPDGFLPQIRSIIQDKYAGVTFDGTTKNGWKWDLGTVYGGNQFNFNVANSNNASQFALGTAAQTQFDAGTLRFNQSTTNLNLSKDFGKQMNLKSFNIAFGTEARFDNYQILAGEEASWRNYNPTSGRVGGAQVFPGFQPVNAVNETRGVGAGYVDIETDLTDKFLVNAAARYEKYTDFGGNVAGKLAARYKFSDKFSIRGSVSNGFRAPSMHQQYFSAISTVFVNTTAGLVPLQQGTFRNNSAVVGAGFGVPRLTAEKSMNYSIGFTSKLARNASLTVDAYLIDIKDRIVLSGQFTRTNPAVNAILQAYPDVNSAIFFSNAINTRTQGIDIVYSSNHRVGRGILDITAAANLNRTEVTGVNQSTKLPNDSLNSNTLFNIEERSRIEIGQPRSKITLGLNYRIGKWNLNARATRFGEVGQVFNGTDRSRDQTFSPRVVTDVAVSYRPVYFINLTIGAQNIADVYPDRLSNFANTGEGRFVYSRNVTQFGFNGGYWYTNAAFDLTDLKGNKKLKAVPVAPMVADAPKVLDTDGDGINDDVDACPNAAGPKSLNGCPDTDGDGVADKDDKCPTVVGARALNGCPDADGDGVADKDDKCPNQYGVAKYDGCPVPDTDGDGVNDELDKCPTVAGIAANAGCPETPQQKITKAAQNVYFVTNSAKLTLESKTAFVTILEELKANPDVLLDIEGHTDNTGSKALNQRLSQQRAETVKRYLTELGVDAKRMTAKGFGDAQPIADNASAEGRQQNRRVVLTLK
ncbi:MAG: TonB-dependent receptor [Bacteroidetes bacterium]|nr:MAG: TonB-dependent receptor [Bacteroidota bacterium]